MLKEFKDLSSDERRFIFAWVDNASSIIRRVFRKKFNNLMEQELKYKDKAKTLLSMFDKYKSSYPKNLPIYRGIKFDNLEQFNKYKDIAINTFKNENLYILDNRPMSFSKDKNIAKGFAQIGKYSVFINLQKRESNDLDLEKVSPYAEEKEIIVKHNLTYKIIDLKEYDNALELVLEEVSNG